MKGLLKPSNGLNLKIMEMDNNTYAVVTGASDGIGGAIARELASRKHDLILHSLPDQGLSELCGELENNHKIHALHYEVDLTAENGPQSLFEFVKSKQCEVNILVNNAGIGFEDLIESYIKKQIDCMILLNKRALTLLTFFSPLNLKLTRNLIF